MSELPDLRNVRLGASPETVRRWEEEDLIKPTPLPEGVRWVTREEVEQAAAEGKLYGLTPKGLLKGMLEDSESTPESS